MKIMYTASRILVCRCRRFVLLLALVLLPVCTLHASPTDPPTASRPATRIVPLYGALTETMLAMGLEDLLVARTTADNQPELARLPSVGTHMRPNLEKIAALKPDLVLQFAGREEAQAVAGQLKQLEIPVLVFQISTFEELFQAIQTIGKVTGHEDAARALEERLCARLTAVANAVQSKPRPSVFFEIRYPILLGAGKDSIVNAIISAAGGKNCLDYAQKQRTVRLNAEQLMLLQPDVYVYQQGPMNPQPPAPHERALFSGLRAVQMGKILHVKEELFSRPSPKAVDATEKLARFLHPEAF